MKNISFDNPYLLLLLIPLVLLIVVPFFIAIKKENKSKGATIALVCHLLIVALAVLGIAGMKHTTVMTKTELYVLADVSASTSEKTEQIDSYIKELSDNLPRNSEMGVITFAADYKLHTELGEDFVSVSNSGVDASATDILSALKFAETLFSDNTIKRIVLYTDGMSTDPTVNSGLIRTIEDLNENNVYIDVVYINSNLGAEASEVQISDVEFNKSTYLGHETTAGVLIEATKAADAIVRLNKNGTPYLEKAVKLSAGYNVVNLDLDTSAAGELDYSVSVYTLNDTSVNNNQQTFTQIINENVSVLLITDNASDVDYIKAIYGANANVDAYVKPATGIFNVPFTVEELCRYDEYVFSNVKVEEINNADNLVSAIDTCVSVFGKSLITAGDNNLHNSEATSVDKLRSMLPVSFGNTDADPKLYTIVIDASRSMEFKNFDFFTMAKMAGKYMLDFLNEEDYFALVYFAGEAYVPITPTEASDANITRAKEIIDSLEVTQGTMIGKTLEQVYDMMMEYTIFTDKQVMLISDGMSFEGGEVYTDDPVGAAAKLKAGGIIVSAINAGNTEGITNMQNIASAGGGKYYFAESSKDLPGIMFDEVADDVTETFITGKTNVIIARPNDAVFEGVAELPPIDAYVYAKSKVSAENVLYAEYVKSSGTVVKAPIYSYWNYGNGKVSTITTSLGGEWTSEWSAGQGFSFLNNITTTNVPAERNDYPYTVETLFDGKNIHVEIVPLIINPDATMTVSVKLPDGTTLTEKLTFDSYRYFYSFETKSIGKYKIDTTYDLQTKSYTSTSVFSISYSPEYNSFETFSPATLHSIVRNNGTVTEEGNVTLTVDESRVDTYVLRFTVPFLAVAVVLYVVDTVIRKLRWQDIVSFFKKRKKEAKK